jgi:hypothetical protein
MGSEYPEHWNRIRRRVYRRDDYMCQSCGAVGGAKGDTELHAHHITPRSQGGSDQPENLTTLCQACHSQVHGRQVGSTQNQSGDPDKDDSLLVSILAMILGAVLTAPIMALSILLGWNLNFLDTYFACCVIWLVLLFPFFEYG